MRYIKRPSVESLPRFAFAPTANAGSFEDKAQVTVSGAKYKLNGQIVKTEKGCLLIRKASGEVVRVAVTEGNSKHPNLSPLEKLTWRH